MKIKKGASIAGIRPEMIVALMAARRIYAEYGVESRLVITSGTEEVEKRGVNSLHSVGLALDLRHPGLAAGRALLFAGDLEEAVGPEFDVIFKSDHVHIEFQP